MVVGSVALVVAGAVGTAGGANAASASGAIPGATYVGKGAQLTVDVTGTSVTIQKLPIDADCTKAPANLGDYGSTGLGPFTIGKDGSFTNVARGSKPGPGQTVVKGRFAGGSAKGTVVAAALKDATKGFDCKRYSGSWAASRKPGTGDTTKPGATYATDDFSKATSGFDTFNEDAVYAEYLPDHRFRIGFRSAASASSLRDTPETATADITVTTGFTKGSGLDGAGLACQGTDALSYIAGYVALDGTAHLARYVNGQQVERADPVPVPTDLLKTGDQAQNEVRLVCTPSTDNPDHTDATLSLNGKKVLGAVASAGGPGKVGVYANSSTGDSEFTFSDFSVRKPRS
jgi:hypothetical protein